MRSLLIPLILGVFACSPADDGAPDCTAAYFLDGDADGHGDPAVGTTACTPPSGYTATADDCDDANALVHPDAPEVCDGVDDDCDGTTDADAIDAPTWFADRDDDGYGDDASAVQRCDAPAGHVDAGGDCDDLDAAVSPDGVELCNGIDDDCDGLVDSLDASLLDGQRWYVDADGDHYGDPTHPVVACEHPTGTVDDDHDCDDADASVNPDSDEVCDEIDNDCDGLADDADVGPVLGETAFYIDSDGDGLGNHGLTQEACVAPDGWVIDDHDCDDGDASVLGPVGWFFDFDYDGYGGDSVPEACSQLYPFYSTIGGDCDDQNPDVYPTAPEICDDLRDNNCDGTIDGDDPLVALPTWYADADGDDFGDDAATTSACSAPDDYVARGGDCDDGDRFVNPDSPEYCDGQDNDCDGKTDEAVVYLDWYPDSDDDGYGDDLASVHDCVAPSGYTDRPGDCDDAVASTSPAESEVCGNGADDDCDGVEDNCQRDSNDPDFLVQGVQEYCSTGGLGENMATPDLDADGVADLVFGLDCYYDTEQVGAIVYGPVSGITSIDGAVELRTAEPNTELGATLAAGDADGDGLDDVFLGSIEFTDAVFLYLGPITADRAEADIKVEDGPVNGSFSWGIDLVPDVDGDGARDLLIGAPTADCSPDVDCGAVYVVPAAPAADLDVTTDATYKYYGIPGDRIGYGTGDVGDTNGDGLTDVAMTARFTGTGGVLYIVDGGAAAGIYPASAVASATFEPIAGTDQLRDAEILGTDYDGDGTSDILVGAPGAAPDGRVFVFLGPVSGAVSEVDAWVTWLSGSSGANLGSSVAVDDMDGDGQIDVLMGAEYSDEGAGAAYLQLGKAAGAVDVKDIAAFPGPADWTDEQFGVAVGFVPDWTGDGRSEIAIGASDWGESWNDYRGRIYGHRSETVFSP